MPSTLIDKIRVKSFRHYPIKIGKKLAHTSLAEQKHSVCINGNKRNKSAIAFTKTSWSTREDQILGNLVKIYGSGHWKDISQAFNLKNGITHKRTGKQ